MMKTTNGANGRIGTCGTADGTDVIDNPGLEQWRAGQVSVL